jgi:hypothetical protein
LRIKKHKTGKASADIQNAAKQAQKLHESKGNNTNTETAEAKPSETKLLKEQS